LTENTIKFAIVANSEMELKGIWNGWCYPFHKGQ